METYRNYSFILFILLSFSTISFSQQSTQKKILGTFVYDKKVYLYEFNKNDLDNYVFKIYEADGSAKKNVPIPETKSDSTKKNVKVPETKTDTTKKSEIAPPSTDKTEITKNDNKSSQSQNSNSNESEGEIFSEFNLEIFRNLFIKQFNELVLDSSANQSTINAKTDSIDNKPVLDSVKIKLLKEKLTAVLDSIKNVNKKSYKDSTINQNLITKAQEIFYKIQLRLEFEDDEPVTAHLILKQDQLYSILLKNESVYYDGELGNLITKHKVDNITVETDDGTFKNVIVDLVKISKNPPNSGANRESFSQIRKFIQFKNRIPISISAKFDPERFAEIKLFCDNCGGVEGLTRFIKLSDVLIYNINLENDKDDYSPANTIAILNPAKPIFELRKENRSKILEVAAFTDFVGLDEKQPNGLIQIEAKRKINLNTLFNPFSKSDSELADLIDFGDVSNIYFIKKEKDIRDTITYYYYTIAFKNQEKANEFEKIAKKNLVKDGNTLKENLVTVRFAKPFGKFSKNSWTYLSSIEPRLRFSKIEENQRSLPVNGVDTLYGYKLFQYQNTSFGFNLNLFKFNFPQAKFTWNALNYGLYWFRTAVNDNSKISNIDNVYHQFNTNVMFRPDARWGGSMGINFLRIKNLNNTYTFQNNSLWQFDFDGYLKTNNEKAANNNKLFFRFRLVYAHTDNTQVYPQMQLGYLVDIFKNRGSSKTN